MQTILYRCGLMLTFTIIVSISSASDVVAPGCVKARTDAFQKVSPVDLAPDVITELSIPSAILLVIAT
jgi:hypothetical protein